jgi:outer membrane protein assembly factor BamD
MTPRYTNRLHHSALKRATVAFLLLTFLLNSGCAWWKKEEIDTELLSAETLYGQAAEALLNQRWEQALTALQSLEARYPYGKFAKQAQLDTAYAHYKLGQDGLAIAAADRFLTLNPTHPSVDYAYYIKGLASFKEVPGWKGVITGRTNLADRDPSSIRKALDAFNVIVNRFPNSRYKSDAEKRIVYLKAARAEQQISVARFYYTRGAYIAAVNRSKIVLDLYTDGPQIEDALGIMFLSYQQMRMADLADDTQRILVLNYPESRYLTTSVNPDSGNWLGSLFSF